MATLEELEERILEQEHRPVAAIKNFISLRPTFPKGDPRRRAITFSVIWALFFSPGGVAAVGSVVALASLAMLGWQNYLMRDSNALILTQIQSEERVALQSQRLSAIRDLYGNDSAALRSEALLTLTTITNRLYELSPDSTHLIRKDLQRANLQDCVLDYKEIAAFDFSGANFKGAQINAGAFSDCIFHGAGFEGASLGSAFIHCGFAKVDFGLLKTADGAEFLKSTFDRCDFRTFDPGGAKFRDCKLEGCEINADSLFFREAVFEGTCELKQISSLTAEQKRAFSARTGAVFTEEEDWK